MLRKEEVKDFCVGFGRSDSIAHPTLKNYSLRIPISEAD